MKIKILEVSDEIASLVT